MTKEQEVQTIADIKGQILGDLAETVQWFYRQMPGYYFQSTDAKEQLRHLETIHALRRSHDARLTMVDDGEAGKILFFGRPAVHSLLDVVQMVKERPFHRIELHASRDHALFIYAFYYGPGPVPNGVDISSHRKAILDKLCGSDAKCSVQAERYLDSVDQGYLARSNVDRVVRHISAWSQLKNAEDLHIVVEHLDDGDAQTRFLAATSGVSSWQLLLHVARIIKRYDVSLVRGYLDFVPAVAGLERAMISSVYLTGANGKPLGRRVTALVEADLHALRRQYDGELSDLYQNGTYTLDELEFLHACLGFAGQMLAQAHSYLEVEDVGNDVIRQYAEICRGLYGLFCQRFKPGGTVSRSLWDRHFHAMVVRIQGCEQKSHAAVLEGMLQFVSAIRLTNAFRNDRSGLSFKIDRLVLPSDHFSQRPYGLFFFSGPMARGFHVRFRASARGGLRVLVPRNLGAYHRARDGLLKEVYDLAWAQQLKNKDIPEGGSKCIALVEPGGDATGAVKQLVDSLLDLILPPELVPEVIGAHGEEREHDLIFLGPDENMTVERISWVAQRALDRGLPHAATLMSSKPGSGINHKEFGVTSEGIFRWVDTVLPLIGITSTKPYTVKMTGGPDGDVGGNLLRILFREHRDRVRVLGISDGTGCAQDPAGLDWPELLRLVDEGCGIAKFQPAKLHGSAGSVVPASDKAAEALRNNLHNVLDADVFLPCGGRPYTINDNNWRDFLRKDGRPSARAMIEGANLFPSSAAREELEKAGLLVIKDSSANKGGVICSSYEVLAGLTISDDEFRAIKSPYVADVIAIIRARANDEAAALLSAWVRRNREVPLSTLSAQFSDEINRVSGLLETVITKHLEDPDCLDYWRRHLEAHCPAVLVEKFRDRLATRIPRPHRIAILAKRLASRMVYREGLTWCKSYLRADRLWDVLSTYLKAEAQVKAVSSVLSRIDFPDRDTMLRVIVNGSQRELVRERLGRLF